MKKNRGKRNKNKKTERDRRKKEKGKIAIDTAMNRKRERRGKRKTSIGMTPVGQRRNRKINIVYPYLNSQIVINHIYKFGHKQKDSLLFSS